VYLFWWRATDPPTTLKEGMTIMKVIDLNKGWNLRYENLSWGMEKAPVVLAQSDGWMQCDVPCDVHIPLIEKGIIKEPLEALNCFDCEWIEKKSWWFRKDFIMDGDMSGFVASELTFEALDVEADIFLNGIYLGHHRSAHYPFTKDVQSMLRSGDNTLLVRVTSGLEYFNDKDISPFEKTVNKEPEKGRGDARRVFLRKAQYVYGWDWGPRVATCGIVGDVYIKQYSKVAVRGIHVVTKSIEGSTAVLSIEVEAENLHPFKSLDGTINLDISFEGERIISRKETCHYRSGLNFLQFDITIDNPNLWWPNGMGAQALYTLNVTAQIGEASDYQRLKFGIRTIRVKTDPINEHERFFAFEVNGVKTFCKGGNWIPADSIYARVTDEKYDALLSEAREANFTMLRIWGGGIYERDIFYQKCDEYGILVWHDFMFACALYPDNLDWFQREVENEIDYQTKRLRNHPCIALWCGNNENHWGFMGWWRGEKMAEFFGGGLSYNRIAPAIVEKNCPEIFYWNSSPYGGAEPNGYDIGDTHHWDLTMNADMKKRITPEGYDNIPWKFVSEYGYIGPCVKSTIEKYHAGNPVIRYGDIWNLHNNTFEKDTVAAGITKHYRDSDDLDIDSYLLYAGLCQGLMYEYSLESIRFSRDCWGSLFWMYNDCWGEVGWTIIDYYLKRKPSFYYVKRAFAPVNLILRSDNNIVKVMGVNDTPKSLSFDVEYGYISFDGSIRETNTTNVTLEPFSKRIVLEFEKGDHDYKNGVVFVRPTVSEVLPAVLRTHDFRELNIKKPELRVSNFEATEDTVRFMVSTDTYAHAVHFNLDPDIHLSDEYFDLLPGQSRTIEIMNGLSGIDCGLIKPECVWNR
jgi:beta-mannosidase